MYRELTINCLLFLLILLPLSLAYEEPLELDLLLNNYRNFLYENGSFFPDNSCINLNNIYSGYMLTNNLAVNYKTKGEYFKAIYFFNESLKYNSLLKGRDNEKALLLENIGTCYTRLKLSIYAIPYFEKAAKIFKEIKDTDNYILQLISLARAHANVGNFELSLEYLNETIKLANENNYSSLLEAATLLQYKIYQANSEDQVMQPFLNVHHLSYPSKLMENEESSIQFDVTFLLSSFFPSSKTRRETRKINFCYGDLNSNPRLCSDPIDIKPEQLYSINIPLRIESAGMFNRSIYLYSDGKSYPFDVLSTKNEIRTIEWIFHPPLEDKSLPVESREYSVNNVPENIVITVDKPLISKIEDNTFFKWILYVLAMFGIFDLITKIVSFFRKFFPKFSQK